MKKGRVVRYRLCRDNTANERLNKALDLCVQSVLDIYPSGMVHAVVLTGSMARGEGSACMRKEGSVRVYGDIEMLVVFDDTEDMAEHASRLKALGKDVTGKLKDMGVLCDVEYGPAPRKYFAHIRPHIFGFELKKHAKVLWGDESVLDLIPDMKEVDIPVEDAWMLLSNRVVEQLLCLDGAISGVSVDATVDEAVLYNHCKMILDLATSILVFTGMYRASYEERATMIDRAVRAIGNDETRDALAGFPDKVRFWTEAKLDPVLLSEYATCGPTSGRGSLDLWLELVPLVRAVWTWETNLLTGGRWELDPRRLAERVLSSEGFLRRLKGWARLALNREVSKTPAFFRKMTGGIFRGSPRYLVYISSILLYFSTPGLLNGGAENEKETLDFIGRNIPVVFDSGEASDWQSVRRDLVRGWRVYLRNSGV